MRISYILFTIIISVRHSSLACQCLTILIDAQSENKMYFNVPILVWKLDEYSTINCHFDDVRIDERLCYSIRLAKKYKLRWCLPNNIGNFKNNVKVALERVWVGRYAFFNLLHFGTFKYQLSEYTMYVFKNETTINKYVWFYHPTRHKGSESSEESRTDRTSAADPVASIVLQSYYNCYWACAVQNANNNCIPLNG